MFSGESPCIPETILQVDITLKALHHADSSMKSCKNCEAMVYRTKLAPVHN